MALNIINYKGIFYSLFHIDVQINMLYGDVMGKSNNKQQEKTKDKSIEVVYLYKEIQNTAQKALENYLSNLNIKA